MGRHSGFIAFNVGIACAAEQVLSFENFSRGDEQKTLDKLAKEINEVKKDKDSSYLIVMAENLWDGGISALTEQLKAQKISMPLLVLWGIFSAAVPLLPKIEF